MKKIIATLSVAAVCAASMAQSTISDYLNVTGLYAIKPKEYGIVVTKKIGVIHPFGIDIEAIAGVGASQDSIVSNKSKFADFTGLGGFGASWTSTLPNTVYYGKVGAAVVELPNHQPTASVYVLIGKHY